MAKNPNEIGERIVDEQDGPGAGQWHSVARGGGDLSVQAWAENWNNAAVQMQVSHDKIHAVDVDGGQLTEDSPGMLGIPAGIYVRALVRGEPVGLVVSIAPTDR
ncbi:MAG: hypothetical protein AAFV88_14115 [Planctomycetota bacterium]